MKTDRHHSSDRGAERRDPAFALLNDEFAAESLKASYAQLYAGFFGTVILAVFTVVALRFAGETEHFAVWLTGHGVVLAGSVAIYIAYQNGRFKSADAAHAARRLSALAGGVSWGVAGLLWPITAERPSWIVFVGTYTVLATGAVVTMATDPMSFVLLVVGTMVPALWEADIEPMSWVSSSIVIYHVICFVTLVRNRTVFRNMVNLRSENSELLKRALASASAAEQARDQAVAAANDKARFLAAASHDLRQPMQALTLLSETLERSASTSSKEVRGTASSINHAALELTSLFEGILDLSQLELGQTNNEPTTVDVLTLLQDIADRVLYDAEARDMTVSVAGQKMMVYADPLLLWRVLSNLVNNALAHSGSDRVLLSARPRDGYCLIQVWDQGKGIREADQARIFEEFAQLENPERRRDRGTGLGLSIVRRVCALTGWKVGVVSRVGRGSTFFVRVPVSVPTHPERTKPVASDVHGLRVLIVEDDELVLNSLASSLHVAGALVTTAESAESAFERLAETTAFDVVLSDYRLPNDQTGMHIAASLATSHPGVPCILLTGELQALPPAEGFAMPTVIRKPASHETICHALSEARNGPH